MGRSIALPACPMQRIRMPTGMTRRKPAFSLAHGYLLLFALNSLSRGCRLVTEVAGQPILLVRNKEGAIHGFYNVCRHRGTTLCNEKKGKSALITCPYHSWTYDLDGKLKARPHFHGAAQHDIHKPASEEDTILIDPGSHRGVS